LMEIHIICLLKFYFPLSHAERDISQSKTEII